MKKLLLACAIAFATATAAHAASFDVNATDPNTVTITSDPWFEYGFTGGGTYNKAAGAVTFTGRWFTPGGANTTTQTYYVVATAGSQTIVEELSLTFSNAANNSTIMTGTFQDAASGSLGDLPSGTPASNVIVAGGTKGFSNAYLGGSFEAGTASTAVPEPASLALLGMGLIGAGALRRRAAR